MRGRVLGSLAVGGRSTKLAPAARAFGLATIATAAALGGCGGEGDAGTTGSGRPQPSAQPERIVVAAGAKPRTLDAALATRQSERIVSNAIQTPLLTFSHRTGDEAARLEPALALRLPRLTDDRLEYRFTLRPGLVYADGRLVKASDVERAIAHASKVAAEPVVRGVLRGIVGAPSSDGQTLRGVRTDDRNGVVVVRLRQPDGRMPSVLANPSTAPLPELPSGDAGALPASTGPLRVARVTDDSVELVANPLRAKIDSVPAARTSQISVLGRQDVTSRDLADGAVGVALTNARADATALGAPAAVSRTVNATSGAVWALLVPTSGPFAERRAREALDAAIDRRVLDDAPGYRPACGLVPAWVVGSDPQDDCPPVPVSTSAAPLLGTTVRVAAASPPTSGAPATTPATTPTRAASSPWSVTTAAIESLGGVVVRRSGVAPEQALADGTADAALVRIDPALPHPAEYLQPVAPLDALVARSLPSLTARPLTGSAGAWSALERRVVARAVAIPLASDVNSAVVGRSVEPRSVVLHPVLGLELAALRLR